MANTYWGSRIETQLRYLREVSAANGNCFDCLIEELTEKVNQIYQAEGAITKQSALEIELAMEPASGLCKAVTVSCVAHAHIDMNWMWRYDETAMLTVDTFRTMLQLMKEYPAFTFAQSQASVYKIIEECAPEMLPEIRQRIKEGRWEVTASQWVETDKNMPSGESLTRHLLYTKQYLKELLGLDDGQFEIDYEPDTFGHGANVPEVLQSGGVKYMYHCRGYDGHNLYKWQAPSGARVTVYREPTWYNETIDENSFQYVPGFCAKHGLDRLIHVYGVGDHGGGATRRDIERLLDYGTWPCMPEIKFGRYIDFFKYIETLDLPVVDHELNFIFDGCYTSQSRIKKANRVAEAALFESEFFNAMSHRLGAYAYDAPGYAALWQNVLFNHFHDILPGSGTIDTREYALGLFQKTMAGAGTKKSAALRGICARINTAALLPACEAPKDSVAEGAGAGAGLDSDDNSFNYTACAAVGGKKRLFALFNPNQGALQTASVLTVWDWDGDTQKIKITDETGQSLEHELLDSKAQNHWGHMYFRVSVACEIPGFGWRTVLLEEDGAFCPFPLDRNPRTDRSDEYVLENEHVRAAFDSKTAALVSFIDKNTGREHVKGQGALFRYIEEDTSRGMTSWRVGRHMSDTPVTAVKMSGVSGSLARKFTFEAPVQNSKLKVTVSLDKHARHLRYAVSCDWRAFGDEKKIPQLAFRVPLAEHCGKFTYDNAFGLIERGALDNDVPGQSFACAGNLMLSGDSKYGFRCTDNAMAVTLIRSSTGPDPAPEIYTHTFNINVGLVAGNLIEASQLQNRVALTVACGPQEGDLPLTGSFVRVNGDAVVSSVKMSEDGGGMIVRLYSVSDEDGEVTLEFFRPVKAMVYVDAHENELAGVEGKILCKAKSVTAVKIKF